MAVSLRSWISDAREVGLRSVAKLVKPMQYEATALAVQLRDGNPLLFEHVADLSGNDSGYGLLFNAYATRDSLGLVLSIKAGLGSTC